MLRTIAISLVLLLSVGVMLPFSNSAHGVRQSAQLGARRHRYHSRAWWRRYRARLRKKRAAAAELAHRKAMLGQPQVVAFSDVTISTRPRLARLPITTAPTTTATTTTVATTTGTALQTTIAATVNASDVRTPVKSVPQRLPGQLNVSVVALSRPNPVFLTAREESKMLAGTPVAELRRIVIDKMIEAGGWVINDFVREMNGARVFVVTARTPRDANSPEKAWTFYFTEADERIYALTTDAPLESAERMSVEAERFINKLHVSSQPNNR